MGYSNRHKCLPWEPYGVQQYHRTCLNPDNTSQTKHLSNIINIHLPPAQTLQLALDHSGIFSWLVGWLVGTCSWELARQCGLLAQPYCCWKQSKRAAPSSCIRIELAVMTMGCSTSTTAVSASVNIRILNGKLGGGGGKRGGSSPTTTAMTTTSGRWRNRMRLHSVRRKVNQSGTDSRNLFVIVCCFASVFAVQS